MNKETPMPAISRREFLKYPRRTPRLPVSFRVGAGLRANPLACPLDADLACGEMIAKDFLNDQQLAEPDSDH